MYIYNSHEVMDESDERKGTVIISLPPGFKILKLSLRVPLSGKYALKDLLLKWNQIYYQELAMAIFPDQRRYQHSRHSYNSRS